MRAALIGGLLLALGVGSASAQGAPSAAPEVAATPRPATAEVAVRVKALYSKGPNSARAVRPRPAALLASLPPRPPKRRP
ncbi:MAG: hypothetical protein HYR48_05815 [Gemmatimonadetes bacterium]|nr:hypothetical protein [Gemmatimonadota bacterium]